jgi:hypothetical protein
MLAPIHPVHLRNFIVGKKTVNVPLFLQPIRGLPISSPQIHDLPKIVFVHSVCFLLALSSRNIRQGFFTRTRENASHATEHFR